MNEDLLTALEKAAAEEGKTKSKGAASKNKADRAPRLIPSWTSNDASGTAESSD